MGAKAVPTSLLKQCWLLLSPRWAPKKGWGTPPPSASHYPLQCWLPWHVRAHSNVIGAPQLDSPHQHPSGHLQHPQLPVTSHHDV